MKLAIVSDIHGNLTALDAVVDDIAARGVDEVIHGGDLALAGAQGAEVVDRIRELGWDGIVGNVDELRETYGTPGAPLVVYGHIHRPFVRATVANSGSVGSPFDGDPRATYLLVADGRAEVVRVEYDVEREADLVLRSGYPDAERIAEMRRSGRFVGVRRR